MCNPKAEGKAIEKAFEGKLPESFAEKELRKAKLKFLHYVISIAEGMRNQEAFRRANAKRDHDTDVHEYLTGRESAFRDIEKWFADIYNHDKGVTK